MIDKQLLDGGYFAQPLHTYIYFQTFFFKGFFPVDEVVVATNYRRKTDALKLDVPAKFIPISTNSITSGMLEKRNIRDIQEASRFLPGVRFRTSYGAFTQFSIRGFDNSVIMVDGVRDERSSIDNSYPFMDLSAVESIELLKVRLQYSTDNPLWVVSSILSARLL